MTRLRVGTRASDLALIQANWVIEQLRAADATLAVEIVAIKTAGDMVKGPRSDAAWPVGAFTTEIERALLGGDIDLAVHSYKDLPAAATPGLIVAAVPDREAVHDVLVAREPIDLDHLPRRFRIGTGSPRRAAQWRRWADVVIVPIRGNVPTRLKRMESDALDGVVLAAAGLNRLGVDLAYTANLPLDRFVPAPAQGALAVQIREDAAFRETIARLDHPLTRRRVDAERSFLKATNAGCHVPVAALATIADQCVALHGQWFSDDGERLVEGIEVGGDAEQVGTTLANRLREQRNP